LYGASHAGTLAGDPSRWSTERSGQWEPLRPELVVEARFDHVTGGRFRHGTNFCAGGPTGRRSNAPSTRLLELLDLAKPVSEHGAAR
jgi:hypothetical protein